SDKEIARLQVELQDVVPPLKNAELQRAPNTRQSCVLKKSFKSFTSCSSQTYYSIKSCLFYKFRFLLLPAFLFLLCSFNISLTTL
ncbi:MAG TPA: hypothetical protein PK928_07115, partial [Candidatus Cloacimonas sp.]|nr:hypothetical protein [Candidatus Cloacimonas sp.]